MNFPSKNIYNNTGKIFYAIIIVIIIAISFVILTSTLLAAISPFNTQTPNPQVQSSSVTNNSTQDGQLKFFLKLVNNKTQDGQQSNNATSYSSSYSSSLQTQDPSNLKNVTININIQQGQGPIKKLPIKAIVSKETTLKDLQLCISIGNDTLQCQPLSHNKTTLNLINQ
jgi:hypothetical protein